MRGRAKRAAVGADFGGHQPFGTRPKADQHGLAGPQFGNAIAPQRFHVHENVGRALAPRQEAETAQAG